MKVKSRPTLHRDLYRRLGFFRTETSYVAKKYIINSSFFSLKTRSRSYFSISKKYDNCRLTKIHNYCIFTGRSRSIFSRLRISRITFRNHASFGHLYGVKRSSW